MEYEMTDDLLFKPGAIVMHYLTGEYMMVLEVITEEKIPGYVVRRSGDYGVMNVGEFEVGPMRSEEPPGPGGKVPQQLNEEVQDGTDDNGSGSEGS